MPRQYLVLSGDVKPHVIAAMLNPETPIYGAEQRQTQVCVNMIVDQRVVL